MPGANGYHKYTSVTGLASTSYPGTAQVAAGFSGTGIRVHNRAAADPVFFSFDGVTDHGRLASGEVFHVDHDFIVQTGRVWIRLGSGVGPDVVDVTQWG